MITKQTFQTVFRATEKTLTPSSPPTGWLYVYLRAWEGREPSKSTIAQYYNDSKNNCCTMPWAEVSLEQPQSSSVGDASEARQYSADWRVTTTAAAAVHLDAEAWALSHFLCRFWSKSPGQPTSLYSSVNAGKKALISFLSTSQRPRGGISKSQPRGQHWDALSPPSRPPSRRLP